MNENYTQFAFTDSVKEAQEKYGSRKSYAKQENSGDRFILTEKERPFIETRDSFYMATVGENGWPYVQFRGGPRGFLKILDDHTLGFADFRGNRQYISTGNINSTHRVSLILLDYPSRQRLKIWAEAEVHDATESPGLVQQVHVPDYKAIVERVLFLRIRAYDWNCPQHITPRYTLEEIDSEVRQLNPELLKSCCPDELAD
jgi:predicted pyridoxine 5'-phosphate oxidase superfamily flavin-nucleotide-binding protein